VEVQELMEFLGAADVYITSYLNEAQITSGTLAYALGSGKAAVSTPYWYCQEMLADGHVPNVVYSCGAMIHQDYLYIPYGMSDAATGMACVPVDSLLDRLVA
jgi:hypothetical protein